MKHLSLKDLNPSPEEEEDIARLLAKKAGIKDELLSALNSSKQTKKGKKTKTNFFKAKIEEIRKEFNESRYKFSKLKIKEIRKNLHEIENEKKPSKSKIKELEKKSY